MKGLVVVVVLARNSRKKPHFSPPPPHFSVHSALLSISAKEERKAEMPKWDSKVNRNLNINPILRILQFKVNSYIFFYQVASFFGNSALGRHRKEREREISFSQRATRK